MSNTNSNIIKKDSESTTGDNELVDIEDIVPSGGGNSLFLCISRALIYISYKNPTFCNALNVCCGISTVDMKSDIHLQAHLRKIMCEYWCEKGVLYDKSKNSLYLRNDYARFFNGNVYDFLIQVYQLSINNFSNNALYRKFALRTLANILNMKLFYKKASPNNDWRNREPDAVSLNNFNEEKVNLYKCLSEYTIYLQEFRSDSSSKNTCIHSNKNVRLLLNKKFWLSRNHYNSKICMKFSQFTDEDELKAYEKHYFCINSSKLIEKFSLLENLNICGEIFCLFIRTLPIQSLMYIEHVNVSSRTSQNNKFQNNENYEFQSTNEENLLKEMEFSTEYNTIGKQFAKFESRGKDQLIDYLNFLWGKNIFNDEYIDRKINSNRNK